MTHNTQRSTTEQSGKPKSSKKQAVVVIHGMGEQRPMATIRSFVNNVWKKDTNINQPHFWNKPSDVSESFEQRRLTTNNPKTSNGGKAQRTDFYEYYWAHHTVNTKWEHFVGWLKTLLWCWPSRYKDHPGTLQPLWYLLFSILAVGITSIYLWDYAVDCIAESSRSDSNKTLLTSIVTIVEAAFLYGLNCARVILTKYFGDVARYVQATPANINIRQAIRRDGIELLEKIHQTGEYDRVVLVGHSLGSIIAYDILNHLWARHNKFTYEKADKAHTCPLSTNALAILEQLELLAKNCGSDAFDQTAYHQLQHELFCELRAKDKNNNWLISDFITLGSPLTYADILVFDDELEFNKRKFDREHPTSPPIPESGHWYFTINGRKYLHHGAVFSSVRWTNIYMPHQCFVKGDLISGPVSRNFSYQQLDLAKLIIEPPANLFRTPIQEIKLDYQQVKNGFTHSDYWQESDIANFHIDELRKALSLY